jgi:AcrR family transcriptional regulator
MASLSRREHLIQTALGLFAERGYHATGIDTILEVAGVSKKTLYHHFRSKDELVLAALRHYDGRFRNGFIRRVEAAAATPRERLLAVFDEAERWFASDAFHGCVFINAIGEYSDRESPIREVCKEFKRLVRSYLHELAAAAHAPDSKRLADDLALLFEGAIVTAQVSGDPRAAQTAKRLAQLAVDHTFAV